MNLFSLFPGKLTRSRGKRSPKSITLGQHTGSLEEFVDLLPEVVFEINLEGRIVFANRKAFELFGFNNETFRQGIYYWQLVMPEDRNRLAESVRSNVQGDKKTGNIYTGIRADGSPIRMLIFNNPVVQDGKIVGLRGVMVDLTERDELTKKIIDKEEYFYTLLENSNDYVAVFDAQMRLNYISPSFFRLTGYSPDFFDKHNYCDLLPPEDCTSFREQMASLLSNTSERFSIAYKLRNANGTWRHIESIVSNHIHNPRITGLVLNSSEVTAKYQARQAQQETERWQAERESLLRVVLDSIEDVIFYKDAESVYKDGNQAFKKFVNREGKDVSGMTDFDFFEKNKAKEFVQQDKEMLLTGKAVFNELVTSGKDGSEVVYETQKSVLYNSDNKPIGIVGVARDVSQTRANDRILKDYARYADFLSLSALDFLKINPEDNIYEIIGHKLGELFPNSFIFINSYDKNSNLLTVECVHGVDKVLQFADKFLGFDLRTMRFEAFDLPDYITGRLFELEDDSKIFRLKGFSKSVYTQLKHIVKIHKTYYIGLSREGELYGNISITTRNNEVINAPWAVETFAHQASIAINRQRLESELLKAKEDAIRAGELKSAFLANMSHEIRTPMNGIIGFGELLRNKTLTEEKKQKYIDIITENSKYLLSLINDILDISKIQARHVKLSEQEYSLNRLLNELYEFFYLALKSKQKESLSLKVHYGIENGRDLVIIDLVRMQQIFNNLLSNAIKFTYEGEITFGYSLNEKAHELCFFVQDTGIGIERSKHELIFEAFTQADHSTTRKYGGTGLGLSISRGLVELMGGRIWVESELGQGSKFQFTLPYKPLERIETEEKENSEVVKSNGKGKSILIVEDDPTSLMLLEEMLGGMNYQLLSADRGLKAVDVFLENPGIDFVLMDINLPDIDGYETTRRIRKMSRDTIIIAQTAGVLSTHQNKALDAGCNEFLTKPIRQNELLEVLRKYQ